VRFTVARKVVRWTLHCCQLNLPLPVAMPIARVARVTENDLYNRIKVRLTWLMTLVFPRVPLCTQDALSVQVRLSLRADPTPYPRL
jgi:hypothetical protein